MKSFLVSCFVLTANCFFAQVNLSWSLTACYALNGNASESVNNLTGTLSAVTTTANRFSTSNSANYFTGSSSSYIILPNNALLKPTNAISFSAWCRPVLQAGQMILVFAKNNNSSFFAAYALSIDYLGGVYKFQVARQNGSGTDLVTGTATLSSNTWYHVVFTLDNTSFKLYVNGTLDGSMTPAITSFNYDPTRGVILGGTNETNYNSPYLGSMDNVRFYDRIISAAEVSAIYTGDPDCSTLAPPVASFSVSNSSPCAGNSVSLIDLSSYSPSTWNWQAPGASTASASVANPTLSFPNPGNYTISLVSSNTVGVSNTATQTITVLPSPTVTISSPSVVCIGQSATLTASGASTYSWSNGQTGSSISVGPAINSSYSVVGTAANGCKNSFQKNMNIVPLPIISVSGNTAVCQGVSFTLTANGALTYSWNTGAIGNQLSIAPFAPTGYTVSGTDANGCSNASTFSVSIKPAPSLMVSGNGTVCQGSPTSLLAGGTAITFTWSNGFIGNLVTVSPLVSTVYTVTGTGLNGCENTATQLVFVNTLPSVLINANNTSVCLGDGVVLNASGATTYSWSGGIQNNTAFYPSNTANYSVIGTGSNGCKNTANVQIVVNPLPVLTHSSSASQALCAGESITLTTGGANIYSWSNGSNLPSTIVTPTAATNYTVTGTDSNGCKSSFVFVINVEACVGLKEWNASNELLVYPNPTSGKITVQFPSGYTSDFELMDVLGNRITRGSGIGEKNVDLTNYPKGLYFLKLGTEKDSKTIKIIKE
jgi:hypothetical protein